MTYNDVMNWHEKTFKDATMGGQITKYFVERKEFSDAHTNTKEELMELADMVIVTAGIARFNFTEGFKYLVDTMDLLRFTKYNGVDLWDAVEEKMKINKSRKWEQKGGSYQHL